MDINEQEPRWVSEKVAQLTAAGFCIETRFDGDGYGWENVQYLVTIKSCDDVITYLFWGRATDLWRIPVVTTPVIAAGV